MNVTTSPPSTTITVTYLLSLCSHSVVLSPCEPVPLIPLETSHKSILMQHIRIPLLEL
eukprot:GDKH01016111.1.p1 GENE.GDKH01016111.1~~GDKH01016111.1.p1  ORF type:complete len:58 (-),score=0.57 GDKH01016111.1:11-184(-)